MDKLQLELSEARAALIQEKQKSQHLYGILDGIMHETRRLNAEISGACDELAVKLKAKGLNDIEEDAERIFYTSGLISSRLTFADFELNPNALTRQAKVRTGIYKKFDKARRILQKYARSKRLHVNLTGKSFAEIDAVPAFELVPFVLLDNAIKYSPSDQRIDLAVEDGKGPTLASVEISSIGPFVLPQERLKLADRGIRGKSADASGVPGQGLGLYLARTLILMSGGSLEILPSEKVACSIQGIDYASFSVRICFRR